MSLYGGIKFSIGDPKGPKESDGSEKPVKSGPIEQSLPGSASTSTSTSTAKETRPTPKASGPIKHLAALTFAPRIRQPKPAVPASTTYSALPVFIDTSASLSKSDTAGPGAGPASGSSSSKGKAVEIVFGQDGKALAKAPAMTLHPGGLVKRERGKEEELRRKQKKKQRRRQQQQQPFSDFKPDEQYDPNRPNDLGEYQYYRKKLREEKKARLQEEKKRKERNGSDGESSCYSDSEEEAPRRDAPKMWAPPSSIYGSTIPKPAPPPITQSSYTPPPPPPSGPPPPPPTIPLSGEDAYARRGQVASGDDAYARRQALSRGEGAGDVRAPPSFARPTQPVVLPGSHESRSGDEAYARRAALAQSHSLTLIQTQATPFRPPPPPSTPPFTPSHAAPPPPSNMPPFAPSHGVPPPPRSTMPPFTPSQAVPPPRPTMPPFTPTNSAPPPNMPPFAPNSRVPMSSPAGPSLIPTPAGPSDSGSRTGIPGFGRSAPVPGPVGAEAPVPVEPAPPSSEDFARMLEERRKAAASIAERLKNLGPAPPTHAPIPELEDGSGTFAEKMMRKWGHKEGTGLGADGTGIKHALTAEHVAKPIDPKQPLSKRQLAKQKAANANAKSNNKKWVMHSTNRGKIVNANEEERRQEEQGKYGEASRVICLVGLVGSEDEIDEDLSEEIGEECSKYGIVERVVQHLVEPPPPDPAECLRVFIVFSGMAGAWRSTKELDGRFFGGRKIRATYFDEARFNTGERDGPIL